MAPGSNASLPQVTILSRQGTKWEQAKKEFDPENVPTDTCYIFLRKEDYPPQGNGREALLNQFKVPMFVANRACTELNGYFGCKASCGTEDEMKDKVTACSTWFRCLVKMVRKVEKPDDEKEEYDEEEEYVKSVKKGYIWFEMGIFTFWDREKCRVLCVDTPPNLPTRLEAALNRRSSPIEIHDPFAMHTDLLDQIILYDEISVWRVRDPVRKVEKSRSHFRQNVFQPMHDVSRHAIHTTEVLSVTIDTMKELQRYQTHIHKGLLVDLGQDYKEQAKAYTDFQIQLVKSLKLRSESNQKRLKDEVDLAFNTLSQEDSAVMKSIALLTMVFLPATFLSALFSTTFFNFGDNGWWQASPRQWIFWVITIPVTIIVVAAYNILLFYSQIRKYLRDRIRDANLSA